MPAEWSDVFALGTLGISKDMLTRIKQKEQITAQQTKKQIAQTNQIQDITIASLSAQTKKDFTAADVNKTKAVGNLAKASLDQAKTDTESSLTQDQIIGRLIELRKLGIEEQKLLQPIQNGAKQ